MQLQPQPHPAAIALGSNLPSPRGDSLATIRSAIDGIAALPGTSLIARSDIIETRPVGPPGQNMYLNAAVLVSTLLDPRSLLASLLEIERAHGRVRPDPQRWGPRTLDLDLLLYANLTLNEPGLQLPHPRLHERAFVLIPLAQIAPNWLIPTTNKSVQDLLKALP